MSALLNGRSQANAVPATSQVRFPRPCLSSPSVTAGSRAASVAASSRVAIPSRYPGNPQAAKPRDSCQTGGVELRHLEYFVAVAEELSFTRASRRLHVVQSGVSSSIQGLERELGVALFDRDRHRVTLTEAGQALLPEARATLAAAQAAADAVAEATAGLRGTLFVGTMISTGSVDVPALLGRF